MQGGRNRGLGWMKGGEKKGREWREGGKGVLRGMEVRVDEGGWTGGMGGR